VRAAGERKLHGLQWGRFCSPTPPMMGPIELESEPVSTLEAPASVKAFGAAPDWEPLPGCVGAPPPVIVVVVVGGGGGGSGEGGGGGEGEGGGGGGGGDDEGQGTSCVDPAATYPGQVYLHPVGEHVTAPL
jgi:hypothetical protein